MYPGHGNGWELRSFVISCTILDPAGIEGLTSELRGVNEALWAIEDRIRRCGRAGDFGPGFVDLARSAYEHEDRRAANRRRIDERLRAEIIGEKSPADNEPA